MSTLPQIKNAIMRDPQNQPFTERGIEPLFAAPTTARINIVGQAPGTKAEQTRLYWNDQSGDRLREWLGVDREVFYHSGLFAVIPMDFAEKWHPQILASLPNIELTILIGQYAQKYYLPQNKLNVTETVKNYRIFLPHFLPLVHPSPRNQLWLAKNPWFVQEVIPALQQRVKQILAR